MIVVGVVYLMNRDTMPSSAKVGDCMHNTGTHASPHLEIVDCGGGEAEFKVTRTSDDDIDCTPGESSHQETRKGSVQTSLCLTDV